MSGSDSDSDVPIVAANHGEGRAAAAAATANPAPRLTRRASNSAAISRDHTPKLEQQEHALARGGKGRGNSRQQRKQKLIVKQEQEAEEKAHAKPPIYPTEPVATVTIIPFNPGQLVKWVQLPEYLPPGFCPAAKPL
jgi:hypothetical protein